jgi:hypothetical protein
MVLVGSLNKVAFGLRQGQFRITVFYGVSNAVPVSAIGQVHVFLGLFHRNLRGSNGFNGGIQSEIRNGYFIEYLKLVLSQPGCQFIDFCAGFTPICQYS